MTPAQRAALKATQAALVQSARALRGTLHDRTLASVYAATAAAAERDVRADDGEVFEHAYEGIKARFADDEGLWLLDTSVKPGARRCYRALHSGVVVGYEPLAPEESFDRPEYAAALLSAIEATPEDLACNRSEGFSPAQLATLARRRAGLPRRIFASALAALIGAAVMVALLMIERPSLEPTIALAALGVLMLVGGGWGAVDLARSSPARRRRSRRSSATRSSARENTSAAGATSSASAA
jgi:hypothetical protein